MFFSFSTMWTTFVGLFIIQNISASFSVFMINFFLFCFLESKLSTFEKFVHNLSTGYSQRISQADFTENQIFACIFARFPL